MASNNINVGNESNDGKGQTLRDGFISVRKNIAEIFGITYTSDTQDLSGVEFSSDVVNEGATNKYLLTNSVTNEKMADDSVGAAELIDNSVGTDALNVDGNGNAGSVLKSDGDGSMSWINPADTLAEVLAIGNTTGGSDIAVSANDDITFSTTSKALFADGVNDGISIYNNYINANGGDFEIVTPDGSGGEQLMASFKSSSYAQLYNNGIEKFTTTTTGVYITGNGVFSGGLSGTTGTLTGALTGTTATFTANVGIGTATIPTYWSGYTALQLGSDNSIFSNTATGVGSALFISQNIYNDGSVYKYTGALANEGGLIDMRDGTFNFLNAPSGTGTATLTNRLSIDSSGNATFAGSVTGTTATFLGTGGVIKLIQSVTGSASYYVMDNTVETGGKKYRFGYTGGSGDKGSFSIYNETDSLMPLLISGTSATFAGNVTANTLTVGSGTSRLTATNAYPLQLNRGLDVDSVGANGAVLGIGTIKAGVYKDGARISGGLQLNGTDGFFNIQTLGGNDYTTALLIDSSQNAAFAGSVTVTGDGVFTGQIFCNTNTTSPATGEAVFYKSSAGAVLSGYQAILETGSGGSRATALTLDSSQNATFAGNTNISGSLGVGMTTSPDTIIHASDVNGAILRLERKDNNVLSGDLLGGIETYRDDDDGAYIQTYIKSYATEQYGRNGYMTFGTNDNNNGNATERIRIKANGDVQFGNGNSYNPLIQFTGSGRVAGSPGYSFAGDLDTGMFNPETGNTIAFSTGAVERMRITSGGTFLINQESANSDADGFGVYPAGSNGGTLVNCYNGDDGVALRAGRNSNGILMLMVRGSTSVGSISVTETSTSYSQSSDYRLKEDLQDFNGLDMISKIPVYDFKWKVNESRSYGVMAHELQEVLPQAVVGEKDATEEYEITPAVLDEEGNVSEEAVMGTRDDTQGVDYSKIVPLLVKSIQELKAEIELLKQNN
jgi:hypothetical protein